MKGTGGTWTGTQARKGQTEYLCVMLEHGADPNTYVEHACKTREHVYWSYTALHAAARKGYTDCVNALLRAGAGASLLDTWTDSSMAADQAVRQPCLDLKDVPARSTALMWAVANGHLDTTRALLATADGRAALSVVGEGGVTALTVAGRRRQLEAAVVLLQHGCPVGSMAEHESYARFLRLAQQRAGKVRGVPHPNLGPSTKPCFEHCPSNPSAFVLCPIQPLGCSLLHSSQRTPALPLGPTEPR